MNIEKLKKYLTQNKKKFVQQRSYTYNISDVTDQTDDVEVIDFEALLKSIDEFAATFK